MKHTAIYVRQSADRADSVSLETQEQLCRQDVPPDETIRVYSDRGYSGKNTDRPALRALLEGRAFDRLVCIAGRGSARRYTVETL